MYAEMEKIRECDLLRDIDIEGFRFVIYDANVTDRYGKNVLGYYFFDKDGSVLFHGEDFACSPMTSIDSDDCCRSLLGFLTLGEYDIEEEYFKDYTKAQLDFRDANAENLSLYGMEEMEDFDAPELTAWEDREVE